MNVEEARRENERGLIERSLWAIGESSNIGYAGTGHWYRSAEVRKPSGRLSLSACEGCLVSYSGICLHSWVWDIILDVSSVARDREVEQKVSGYGFCVCRSRQMGSRLGFLCWRDTLGSFLRECGGETITFG